MKNKLYAHSLKGESPEKWQGLAEHLQNVALKGQDCASSFDSSAWLQAAGILHDIGKAHCNFQHYLMKENGLDASEYDGQSSGRRVNHSGVGAVFAYEKWPNIVGKTLAYLVAGHHAGLPDWHGGRDSLACRLDSV